MMVPSCPSAIPAPSAPIRRHPGVVGSRRQREAASPYWSHVHGAFTLDDMNHLRDAQRFTRAPRHTQLR